ncbi:MAG: YihY/virulence factor BrkB family protein [Ketobacter sp.]|mgnify:FL=1
MTSASTNSENHYDASARGRNAISPQGMPSTGWRDVIMRAKQEMDVDNLGLVSAGVAFYFFLAVFPAMAAFISLYGLLTDTADALNQLQSFTSLLPSEASSVLLDQIKSVTSQSSTTLGLGAFASLLFAFWSSMKGTLALITALNIVYEEHESRGVIRIRAVALLLTVGAIVFVTISLITLTLIPVLLEFFNTNRLIQMSFSYLRWPVLVIIIICLLSVLYRIAPDRRQARWRWVTPGAVLATILWITGSALFSWYVSEFGNFNEVYGSIGAVVLLLFWFYLTAYVVLIGAELNAELEHQTCIDTTIGEDRPMGKRGAKVADTVGKEPPVSLVGRWINRICGD